MATVIKKISELEQLTDLSSSSNVIIEENGKAKRFSAQNIGKVKTVNGIEPDENGNIVIAGGADGTGGASVQADWDQMDETQPDFIKNKPDEADALLLMSEMGLAGSALVDETNTAYLDESGNMIMHTSADYGFKKIGDADVIESANDSTHILVEDDGVLKRIAANKFNTSGGGNSGGAGVSSWNDLTDKPFYEESFSIDIEWDGVIGDRPHVAAGADSAGNTSYLVHVSDEVLPSNALEEMTAGLYVNGEVNPTLLKGLVVNAGEFIMAGTGEVVVVPYDNFDYMGALLFPKAGIYFAKINESRYTSFLNGEVTVINKLDKKYIDHPITLTVSYTYNNAEGGEYTDVSTDLGYAEVAEAYKDGCPIFVAEKITDGSEEVVRCPATVVGDNYVEMLDAYTVFNLVYTRLSDNQMVAIEISHPLMGEQTEMYNIPSSALPSPGYDGQILGVVDGEWSSMDAPSGLPEVNAGNNGNVLTVVDGEWSAGNIDALPAVTAESEGAFLRIVDGVPTWVVLEVAEAGAY